MTSNVIETRRGHLVIVYRAEGEHADWEIEHEVYDKRGGDPAPEAGQTYMIAIREDIMHTDRPVDVLVATDRGGWPGNSDPTVRRYHGWRGTWNDVATYAHGHRRCLSVTSSGKRVRKLRIEFGRDLAADRD